MFSFHFNYNFHVFYQFQEKEDRHLAEILSAEEAMEAKDKEIKKFEKVSTELKHQIQIWKHQVSEMMEIDIKFAIL